jgi:hypothetical protein
MEKMISGNTLPGTGPECGGDPPKTARNNLNKTPMVLGNHVPGTFKAPGTFRQHTRNDSSFFQP